MVSLGDANPSGSASSGGKSPQDKEKSKVKAWVQAIKVIKFMILIATGFVAYINIQPYIYMAGQLMMSIIDNSLVEKILTLPILGQVAGFFSSIIVAVIGLAIWAIFQALEVMPMLLKNDPDLVQQAISAIQFGKKSVVSPSDTPFLRNLKKQFNDLPSRHLKDAQRNAWIAYVVDTLLCCIYFPPIKGGFGNLGLFMMAPSMGDIDWQNVMFIFWTLFAVEFFIGVWLWVGNLQRQFAAKSTKQGA